MKPTVIKIKMIYCKIRIWIIDQKIKRADKKLNPEPGPVQKFMIQAFNCEIKPSSGFLSMMQPCTKLNPEWRWFKPWILKHVEREIDPNAETVEIDIIRKP